MAPRNHGHGLLGIAGILGATATVALLLPSRARAAALPSPGQPFDPEAAQSEGRPPEATGAPPGSPDDVIALARMLASETRDRGARIVIGWITVQRARKSGRSVYQLLTRGRGYGKQDRGSDGVYYASTAKEPTPETLDLAEDLLAGRVQPSSQIREVRPGAWVERKQGVSDERIVQLQSRWKEGLWAQVVSSGRPTEWVLFSPGRPIRALAARQSAAELLDSLPRVEATDEEAAPTRRARAPVA